MATCFISYSSKNKIRATKLANSLKSNNINVWFAESDMMVGYPLINQIYEGIKSSDYLLLIITKSSIKSQWVQKELNFALIEEIEKQKTKVIPLLFEKCPIPDSIKTKVYANFTSNFDDGLNKVLQVIRNDVDFINNNLKSETKIDEIFIPLNIPENLRLIIFDVEEVLQSDNKKKSLNEFSSIVNPLIEFAKNHKVSTKCWEWIDWVNKLLISGELKKLMSSKDISQKRILLKKYFCGRPLFNGGIANKLSLISKVALEIGKVLDGLYEDNEELTYVLHLLSNNFTFSDKFNSQIQNNLIKEKILASLTYELLYYSDYNKILTFYSGLMNFRAINAGFFLTYLPNPESEKFIEKSEIITEYILSELNAVDEAVQIIETAYEVTFSVESEKIRKTNKNQGFSDLDIKVYFSYMDVWGSLIKKSKELIDTNESIKWFLLTLRIGNLFQSVGMGHFWKEMKGNEIIDVMLINEVEQLSTQLLGNNPLNNEIKKFMHDAFYSRIEDYQIEQRFVELIPKIHMCAIEKSISETLIYFMGMKMP